MIHFEPDFSDLGGLQLSLERQRQREGEKTKTKKARGIIEVEGKFFFSILQIAF